MLPGVPESLQGSQEGRGKGSTKKKRRKSLREVEEAKLEGSSHAD